MDCAELKPTLAHASTRSSLNASKPIFMVLCGGSGSGKSFIAKWVAQHFIGSQTTVSILREKDFLKSVAIAQDQDLDTVLAAHDFDNPAAVDWELFEKAAEALAERKPFDAPIFDMHSNKRAEHTKHIDAADIIIVEGRLALRSNILKSLCSVRVFLQTDEDLMLSRRVFKGMARQMDLNSILDRYLNCVKPSYEKYIEPEKEHADLVVQNFGGLNFNIEEFKNNSEIISILQDLLTVRLNASADERECSLLAGDEIGDVLAGEFLCGN